MRAPGPAGSVPLRRRGQLLRRLRRPREGLQDFGEHIPLVQALMARAPVQTTADYDQIVGGNNNGKLPARPEGRISVLWRSVLLFRLIGFFDLGTVEPPRMPRLGDGGLCR